MISLLFFSFIVLFGRNLAEIVKIDQGYVNGTVLHSRNGSPYLAFYAIPYAAPPIGKLRFKPPAEPPKWTGVRQSVQKGVSCIQNIGFHITSEITGSEDCLYLSVFTPQLNPAKPVPVMFYIHGGAFFKGNGDANDVHPLMDKPVVVVTVNYRLGILGLFSSADEIIPGNYALKDQTAALKWVQKNIEHFGGDPKLVTIFGQSSGSASVHLHLMSPLSKGLFHRAIMESGSGRASWAYYNHHHCKKIYKDTIRRTNCTSTSSTENLKCLQELPPEYLLKIEKEIKAEEKLALKYRPVIENSKESGAFLITDPHDAPYQDPSIPVIMGFNSAEGIFEAIILLMRYSNMTILDEKLEEIIPQRLNYFLTTNPESQRNITQMIKKFYFHNSSITPGQEQSLCNMMSDFIFIMPIIDAAIHYPGPKYVYLYDYRNAVSMPQAAYHRFQEDFGIYGACHSDELLSLFYMSPSSPNLTEVDIKFSEKIVNYWTNFAYTGNPNNPVRVPKEWQRATSDPVLYMHINNGGFKMKHGLLRKRHKFWLKCPLSHQYGK